MESAQLRQARAARELAWTQAMESRGVLPTSTAAGHDVPALVLDLDASIVVCHSEKESAAPTWKRSFGYHPLFSFLDATGKPWPGCCDRATPGRTPPPTTSPCWTPR